MKTNSFRVKQTAIPSTAALTEEDWKDLQQDDSEATPSAEDLRDARKLAIFKGAGSEEPVDSPTHPPVMGKSSK